MEEFGKKKQIRAGHRGVVMRISNQISKLLAGQESSDKKTLKVLQKELSSKLEKLESLDNQILELMSAEDGANNEQACVAEVNKSSEIRAKGNTALLPVEEFEEEQQEQGGLRSRTALNESLQLAISNGSSGREEGSSTSRKKVKAKLPKLEIKKFSGKPYDWQEFWDMFSSTVDTN